MCELDSFQGFEREDGTIGIRNHVIVISPVVYTNKLAENIANQVNDIVPVYSQYGRNLKGKDEQLHNDTLIGVGKNPNVGGVLVLGWEEEQMDEIVSAISSTGKPVKRLQYIDNGLADATATGVKKVVELAKGVSTVGKVDASIEDLVVAVECGGSDTTSGIVSNPVTGDVVDEVIERGGTAVFSETMEILGAEDILVDQAVSDEVREKLHNLVTNIEERANNIGYNVNERNPVGDNIEGGITTIEEKSIGAITKAGSKKIQDVLEYGERPSKSGLYFMDTPAAAHQSMSGKVAAGAHLVLFSTGRANPSGTPVSPVVKITGNPSTVEMMNEHIDVDISGIFEEGMSHADAKDVLTEGIMDVINGKLVSAEVLKHRDFAPKRNGEWIID